MTETWLIILGMVIKCSNNMIRLNKGRKQAVCYKLNVYVYDFNEFFIASSRITVFTVTLRPYCNFILHVR